MALEWQGCYDDRWIGLITPESMGHPAKYSRGLIQRIYQYCLEKQYFTEGMCILDPFGGIGLGAIATHYGLNWLGNELELRFCQMAWSWDCPGIKQEDYDGYKGQCESPQDWYKLDLGCCSECVYKAIEGEQPQPGLFEQVGYFTDPHRYHGNLERFKRYAHDGTWAKLTQGDSRKLNEIWAEGLVSSSPYAKSIRERQGGTGATSKHNVKDWETWQKDDPGVEGYGPTDGQLGSMLEGLVSSSPFASSVGSDDPQRRGGILKSDPKRKDDKNLTGDYGDSEGQLAAMGEERPRQERLENIEGSPDTFWEAARTILLQCHSLLAPSSYVVWITKNYIKNGQEVDFTSNWQQLCISCGFEMIEEIQAMLVKNLGTQTSHSGNDHEIIIERKSFFRRLFEANARAAKHWETLSKQDQSGLIMESYIDLLESYLYELENPEPEEERDPPIRPTKNRVISSAESIGWKRDGKIRYDIDTAIDYETVTIMRRI